MSFLIKKSNQDLYNLVIKIEVLICKILYLLSNNYIKNKSNKYLIE